MGRDAAILGMTLFNTSDRELAEIHAAIIAGLANGTLNPVIGRELPLADAARAHEAVMEPGALGKIVLIPREPEIQLGLKCLDCVRQQSY